MGQKASLNGVEERKVAALIRNQNPFSFCPACSRVPIEILLERNEFYSIGVHIFLKSIACYFACLTDIGDFVL